jgi:dCMP deaminase
MNFPNYGTPEPEEQGPDKPMSDWEKFIEGMHRATMNLNAFTERTKMNTRMREIEREVAQRRSATAVERSAMAIKFLTLRPDGRPTFEAAYLAVAQVIGSMGDCSRAAVGAVAVRNHIPLAWGYNGTNPGAPGCLAGACERATLDVPPGSDYHNCIARHAEINLIGFAANRGIALAESTVYVSREPCAGCQKALYAVDVARVLFPEDLTTRTES